MKHFSRFVMGVLVVGLLGTIAQAKTYKWKLAMTWPKQLSPLVSPPLKFAKLVEEMSDGRITVDVHDKNKHKSPMGVFDMVKMGQYQMGHSASYYWKGKDINTMFFTSVPFGMTMNEQYSWFYYGGGMELMQKVYAKHKMYSFPGGNTGVQMGGWFRKEINSVEDLNGLKIRIPGYAGEIFAKVGAAVVNIPGGELYTALERNAIDAVEWVGPGLDIKMGFHKIAPYYYTGWHEPASEMHFMINQKAFDKLPKDLQVIVKTAMKAVAADMHYEYFKDNADAWSKMKTDFPNIKIRNFPDSVLQAMRKANDEFLGELEAKGGVTKEIIESQRAFIKKARVWTKISEYSYLQNMIAAEK